MINTNLNRFLIILSFFSIFTTNLYAMEPPSDAQGTDDIRTNLTSGKYYIRWECLDKKCKNKKDKNFFYLYEGKGNIAKVSPKVSRTSRFTFRKSSQGILIINFTSGKYMYFDPDDDDVKFDTTIHASSYFNFFTPDLTYNMTKPVYVIRDEGMRAYMEPSEDNDDKGLETTFIESPHCFFSFIPCTQELHN